MAIMIPDTVRQNTPMSERRLFHRFRSELPDDCYVLHSLGLVNHEKKIWGECDFVILSRAGIFVIEVKGGRVSCENGMWRFTRADGTFNTKAEGPFEQAKTAMFDVRKAVEEVKDLKGFLFGYGVIMPDEQFTQTGPEIEPGVLLDRRLYHNRLDIYLNRLRAFWTEQYDNKHDGRVMRDPEKNDLEKIRAVLRPDVRTALTLNSSLSRVEQEQVELIDQQSRILRRMDTNPRTLVKGGAGTGKTLLALDTAARRAGKGQRTLYLCFNRLLGRHVREHVRANYASLPVEADSIHGWFRRIIDEAGLSRKLERGQASDDEYFVNQFSDAYEEALVELDYKPFDCLILDEAQDLLNHRFLDALELTLLNGFEAGTWHIFLDPLQTIYGSFDPTVLDRLKGYGYAEFPLTVNCRNTRSVAVSTSMISGIDIPLEEAVEGGVTDTKFIVRDGNQFKALDKLIEKLIKEGVSRDDIVILSKHPLRNSTLAEVEKLGGSKICDLADENVAFRKGVDFCTMHAFKGLERKIVIAWDMDELDNEQNRLLHYCGLSRARSCLFTFINESERPAYDRLAAEFGARQARASEPDYAG
jgi:ATP:corrinoid adenosyltransferase